MKSLKDLIKIYSGFVSHHPYIVLLIVIIITSFAVIGASKIQMESMDYKDMLPNDIDVIITLEVIGDQFGGSDAVMIAVELDPQYKDSDEPRDIRDPEFIKYIDILSESVKHVDDVTRVTSTSTILKLLNNNKLPKDYNYITAITKDNPLFNDYISKDFSLSIIRISLSEDFNEDDILKDMNKIIDEIPTPTGIKVSLAGQTISMPIVKESLGSDIGRTSMFSLIGILVLLFLLFRSILFGLTPLATIGVGILWAFGYIGFRGMGMNSATSGVISMIMGIGIDFGIQTVSRFKQELKKAGPEKAMNITLSSIFMPMSITTMAALIGFKAMGWGELTMMRDMGTMMGYGIASCFLAAITVVPAILVIGERLTNKKLREEDKIFFIEDGKNTLSKEKQIFKDIFKSKNHVKGGNKNENRKKQ